MNSYKKLINNTLIFSIGSFGSNIISFALVPLYTYYLTTEDYGVVDLIISTVSMLLPLITLTVYEAVIRFAIDKNEDKSQLLTNALIIQLFLFVISIFLYPLLSSYNVFGNYLIYFYIILYLQTLQIILQQFVRGIGFIKLYAINGIVTTFTMGTLNIMFIVLLQLGVSGYLWANIISFLISNAILIYFSKLFKLFAFRKINFTYIKKLLSYSLPMVPNSIMYRITNSSSRFFILYFLGASVNGLFAVASKVPLIINMINSIFIQAWQLSAFEEYENDNRSNFYSNVFRYLSMILFLSSSGILIILKKLFELFFEETYYLGWTPVPFLILGVIFSSFSSFLGTNYTAAKETKGVFKTSVYGGVSTILLNLTFIPALGIIGAGIASFTSFFIVFIIRYFDTKRLLEINIDWHKFIKNTLLIILQSSILYLELNSMVEFLLNILLFVILTTVNQSEIREIFKLVINLLKTRKEE